MDGAYRIDEWKRYRTLIPSDRALLELGPGWTSLLNVSKEVRQVLYFVEKHMCVAEICYNMHASPFHVYGQLYDLVVKDCARGREALKASGHARCIRPPGDDSGTTGNSSNTTSRRPGRTSRGNYSEHFGEGA